jgi:hypothetical protein
LHSRQRHTESTEDRVGFSVSLSRCGIRDMHHLIATQENAVCIVWPNRGSSSPGWGNGKATAVLFAREGAKVLAAVAVGRANPDASHVNRPPRLKEA